MAVALSQPVLTNFTPLPQIVDSTLAIKMNRIQTKGRFCFMELPTELRLKIYELLLICDGEVEMPSDGFGETERHHRMIRGDPLYQEPQPSVAIMQTCKLANEETIPILWGKNSFAICLPVDLTQSFFIHNLRWSTISHIASLIFTSGTTPLPHGPFSPIRLSKDIYEKPHFSCTGLDILARHNDFDFRYSPQGPDACMSLSIRNWVSTGVTRAELSRIEQELEALMSNDPLPDV